MAFLAGWSKRIKLDIDYTNDIGASVTHLPIMIFLKAANGDTENVFAEVGTNSQKIAITKADGETQLYAEIGLWDDINDVAIIYVSKSDWTINADTSIYLYYDNTKADNTTYIGLTPGSTPASYVWDSYFGAIHHLKDLTTSSVAESTSNQRDGTKGAANQPLQVDGKIGKGQDFSPNPDKITFASFNLDDFTIELWQKVDTLTHYRTMFTNSTWATADPQLGFRWNSDGINGYWNITDDGAHTIGNLAFAHGIVTGTYYYVVLRVNGTTGEILINLIQKSTSTNAAFTSQTNTGTFIIGRDPRAPGNDEPFDGIIDELRISTISRSDEWLKASYNSGNDSLLTYGTEEAEATIIGPFPTHFNP